MRPGAGRAGSHAAGTAGGFAQASRRVDERHGAARRERELVARPCQPSSASAADRARRRRRVCSPTAQRTDGDSHSPRRRNGAGRQRPAALLRDAHLKVGDAIAATANGRPLQLRVVGEVFDVSNLGHELFMDWSTYVQVSPESSPVVYYVTLNPGANIAAYMRRVAAVEPDFLDVQPNNTGLIAPVKIIDSVLLIVAVVLALIAVGGVFNTLLLNTRERVRDTATLKAVGMSPRQVLVMVASSAGLLALIGGLVATPLGVMLNRVLLDAVSYSAGNDTPAAAYSTFSALELLVVLVLGVAVAIVAALIPGRWAARTNVVDVLHAE